MGHLLCLLLGHKWKTKYVTLECGSGCVDQHRTCRRCSARVVMEMFRRWYCPTHDRTRSVTHA